MSLPFCHTDENLYRGFLPGKDLVKISHFVRDDNLVEMTRELGCQGSSDPDIHRGRDEINNDFNDGGGRRRRERVRAPVLLL
jgi:hypothetical protein